VVMGRVTAKTQNPRSTRAPQQCQSVGGLVTDWHWFRRLAASCSDSPAISNLMLRWTPVRELQWGLSGSGWRD